MSRGVGVWVADTAQIWCCCGCGVGWRLQVLIEHLAWEPTYAAGAAPKKKKKKKKKRERENDRNEELK